MDTAPSTGFLQGLWNKISPQIPGMVNAVGSTMPGPMGQASRATGALMQSKKNKQSKQQGTMPSANTPGNPFGNVNFGGPMGSPMGSPMGMGPGGNTGFTGGMPMGGMMGGGVSPLWSNYGGNPQMASPYPQNRQVMY